VSHPSRQINPRRARHIIVTALLASMACCLFLATRQVIARSSDFSFYYWNLFLAWIPLVFTLLIRHWSVRGARTLFYGACLAWFLFFPNAFYIFTDFVHFEKFGSAGVPVWLDLQMASAFACGGMLLGCLSLYLLQLLVTDRFGWKWGWRFAVGMLALGSLGIYLGRYARLNSWDFLTRPLGLVVQILDVLRPPQLIRTAGFSSAFFLFSLTVYCFVISFARIHDPEEES
jgi:uncharacterized membrane protein